MHVFLKTLKGFHFKKQDTEHSLSKKVKKNRAGASETHQECENEWLHIDRREQV